MKVPTVIVLGSRAAVSLFGVAIVAAGLSYALAPGAEFSERAQIPATPVSFASPELDALAANMAKEIVKKKVGAVVVVGGVGPSTKVTDLGAGLRNAFNESLARQTQGAHVLDGAAVRDMLRKSRVSEGMLYTDAIAAWIAAHSSADAYVTFRVHGLTGNHASLVAELFTKDKRSFQSRSRVSGEVTLTDPQLEAGDSYYKPKASNSGDVPSASVPDVVKCLVCFPPKFPEEAKRGVTSGTIFLTIVVRPDGVADDIVVVKPMGHGMDASAIDAIVGWKFKPATDSHGQAIAIRVPVEVKYERF